MSTRTHSQKDANVTLRVFELFFASCCRDLELDLMTFIPMNLTCTLKKHWRTRMELPGQGSRSYRVTNITQTRITDRHEYASHTKSKSVHQCWSDWLLETPMLRKLKKKDERQPGRSARKWTDDILTWVWWAKASEKRWWWWKTEQKCRTFEASPRVLADDGITGGGVQVYLCNRLVAQASTHHLNHRLVTYDSIHLPHVNKLSYRMTSQFSSVSQLASFYVISV